MDFSSMSGWDFERYCADCLLKKGFTKAEVTSGSGDHGVDIIAEQNGIRFGIQCKLYQGQIPNKAVQEAYTGASYYDCDVAVIMSNSELTKQAKDEAKKLRVKFWDIANYIPEESKSTSLQKSIGASTQKPTTYEEYCFNVEENKKLHIAQLIEEADGQNEIVLAVDNPYMQKNDCFKKSKICLKNLYIIESIELFCSELSEAEKLVSCELLLFQKLLYTKQLYDAVSDEVSIMKYIIKDMCPEIDLNLHWVADGKTDINKDKFNEKYWLARYGYDNARCITSSLAIVFGKFTPSELIRIETGNVGCLKTLNDFQEVIKSFEKLFNAWEELFQLEEGTWEEWPFWRQDVSIKEEIQNHRKLISIAKRKFRLKQYLNPRKYLDDSEQNTIIEELYTQRYALGRLLYELWVKKSREKVLEMKRRKREKEERLIEEAAKQENERLLKERQEAEKLEKERLIKEQQKKELFVQSMISEYNDGFKKINLEISNHRKELESKTQIAISQAQQQISDLLKKKQSFTFFRKERDAKIDATIATVEQYIEQLKKQLEHDIAECDAEAQAKIKALQEQTLDEAEKGGVKEELLKKIN